MPAVQFGKQAATSCGGLSRAPVTAAVGQTPQLTDWRTSMTVARPQQPSSTLRRQAGPIWQAAFNELDQLSLWLRQLDEVAGSLEEPDV